MKVTKHFTIIFLFSLVPIFALFIYFSKPLYQLSVTAQLPNGYLTTIPKIDYQKKLDSFSPFYYVVRPLYPRLSFSEYYIDDSLIINVTSIYPEDLIQFQSDLANNLANFDPKEFSLMECKKYNQSLDCKLDEAMVYDLNLTNIKFLFSESSPIKIRPFVIDYFISFLFLFIGLALIFMSTKYVRKI